MLVGTFALRGATADELAHLRAALRGRYTLERELGRGGTATVWLAEDLKNHRSVALKVLRPELASALTAERFVREIAITGRLTHPHILPLFDSDKRDGFLYYAMPFLPGETLRGRLEREKQLPVEDAIRIASEVADALDYAHRHGVVHRDIKPENILLSEGHAVVADFGVARALAAAAPSEKLTETGLAIGTLHYMSPEQAAGDRKIDGRADIYALACVLYEMLAGVPPFHGATTESVLRQHLAETARPLATFRPGVPEEVERAVATGLAKAPADRWRTGAEFVAALGRDARAIGDPKRRAPARPTIIAVAFACAIAGTAAVMRWLPRPRTANTLAVLYFDNRSGDSADAYLADGLTEEIIDRLGEVDRLNVKSRTAVARFRGKTAEGPATLGRALGVTNLVDGSVRRENRRLRVAVELVRAPSGARLWGARFERPDSALLDVEGEIATAVASAVAGRLAPAEERSLRSRATRDAVAYDHYLRGDHYLAQRTARAIDRAIDEYAIAAARDPGFVDALARQAYGYALFLYYGWPYRHLPTDSVLARGQACAARALKADSTLAEAWLARGRMLEVSHPRTYEGAIDAYRRATALDPRDPEAFNMLGASLREIGDDSGAARAFHQALTLDPDRASTLTLLGIQASLAGRYDEAARWADSALAVDQGFYDAWVSRGFYRLFLGDTAGANADAHVAHELPSGSHLSDETLLVLLDAREGKILRARQRVGQLLTAFDTTSRNPLVGTFLARALLAVGGRERALDILDRVRPRGAVLWFWLRFPGFDTLRPDPRFQRIVAESHPPDGS